jgi:hypothetical protein
MRRHLNMHSALVGMVPWSARTDSEDPMNPDTAEVQRLTKLIPILFWERVPGKRPQDFVRSDIAAQDRQSLAHVLAHGAVLISYMGWADCRICGEALGSQDLAGFGFFWPQKAEHYVLQHNVWTLDCSLLLSAARFHKAVP